MEEKATIRKDNAVVTSAAYRTSQTIPLVFHFEPAAFESTAKRLKDCTVEKATIEDRDIYLFDNFFSQEESNEMRAFSQAGEFGKSIYADQESREKGEEPAKAMANKEKWKLFQNPPQAIQEIYKFYSYLASKLDADVATLPWEMYDAHICAAAVATNRVEKMSAESMELGKHEDYNTEKGLAFGLPVLYAKDIVHEGGFINGDPGKPWLVSLMLYTTDEGFLPEYGMGTVFCNHTGQNEFKADCRHMRFVLFEGDIIHGIETSNIPESKHVSRVSYVYKLTMNPKRADISLKREFAELIGER